MERIFNMYLAGETVNRISAKLREENIQVPGKRFSFTASMIKGVLRNERYCGDSILQKTVTVDCMAKSAAKTRVRHPCTMYRIAMLVSSAESSFTKRRKSLPGG